MAQRRSTHAQEIEGSAGALYDAMAQLIKVYQFRDRERIHCHGVSVTECYALEEAARHGPLRLGDLARRLHLQKSTMSRVVDSLQRKGLVARREHEQDRRALRIEVTPTGQRLHERLAGEARQRYRTLLEGVPPESRALVIAFLASLARAGGSGALEALPGEPGRPARKG